MRNDIVTGWLIVSNKAADTPCKLAGYLLFTKRSLRRSSGRGRESAAGFHIGKSRVPGKAPSKHFKVGPTSKDRTLARIDKRTRVGRVMRQAIADLSAHVGGSPSAAERLLIQSASIKSARLFLLTEKLLANGETGELNGDNHVLAWLNWLRLDLTALGLEARIRDITPDLSTYLATTATREAAD